MRENFQNYEYYGGLLTVTFLTHYPKLDVILDQNLLKPAPCPSEFPDFMEYYKKIMDEYENAEKLIKNGDITNHYIFKDSPSLTFLGTGSMTPSTYRNVSAINLRIYDKYNILLDCGEGTYCQLIDRIGIDKISIYLEELRIMFITHIHPDHNQGMLKVLEERMKLSKKKKNIKVRQRFYLLAYFCYSS